MFEKTKTEMVSFKQADKQADVKLKKNLSYNTRSEQSSFRSLLVY